MNEWKQDASHVRVFARQPSVRREAFLNYRVVPYDPNKNVDLHLLDDNPNNSFDDLEPPPLLQDSAIASEEN